MQKQLDFNFFKDKEINPFVYFLKHLPILLSAYACFFALAFFIALLINPVFVKGAHLPLKGSQSSQLTQQDILKKDLTNSKIEKKTDESIKWINK